MPAGLVPDEASLSGMQTVAFSLCLHVVEREREFWCLFLIRTPVLSNYFLKALFSNRVMLRVRALTQEFWRDTIQCTKRTTLECWSICGEKVLSHLSRVVGLGKVNKALEWDGRIVAMW